MSLRVEGTVVVEVGARGTEKERVLCFSQSVSSHSILHLPVPGDGFTAISHPCSSVYSWVFTRYTPTLTPNTPHQDLAVI